MGHRPEPLPTSPVVVPQDHYVSVSPDPSLRSCRSRVAGPRVDTDADESLLIVELDERGEDCAAKLSRTWSSIDKANADALAAVPKK